MLCKVTQLSVAGDKSSSGLSWCLLHLITIVDTQGYTVPYISSKKFKWTRPEAYDPQKLFLPIGENETELGFIDLLIKAAFIFQPYIVENFIQGLIKKGIRYNIEASANPEQPITLGIIFDFELARSIDQALKITLEAFRQKPRLYLVHIINNYLELLRILRNNFQSLLESLSGAEKVEVCQVLQNIINTVYTIYCEMLLRTDNLSTDLFDFKFCENFLEILHKRLFEHQLNGAVDWLATNFSFILVNLEKIQAFAKSAKHSEILDLEHFISRVSGGETIPAKTANEVKLRMFEGVSRQNALECYELAKEPKFTEVMVTDEEICEQVKKKHGQKEAMKFETDCMKKFYLFYEVDDTKSNCQNIKKYFEDLAVSKIGERFEKLSIETRKKLCARYDERQIAARALQKEEEEEKQAVNVIADELKIQPQEPMSNVGQEETIVLVTPAVETLQRQLSSNALESQETKNEVPLTNLENPVKMVHEDDSTEVLFLGDLDVLRKNCEKLPSTQKQFIECLSTQENEFKLSISELTIEKIVENRKAFLEGYILSLSPEQAKLFVEYSPAFLKEQLDPQLLNSKLFHPDHKQMLTDIIQYNDLLEKANFEMFDLLNASLSDLRRTLEKDADSQIINSPLKKPQKDDDSQLTEEHKDKLAAAASAFMENASQLQKAAYAITWLYQADRDLEIFLIISLAEYDDKQVFYGQVFLNPSNQLRFLASMLLILEDHSLTLFKKLAETHNKKTRVTYNELCENALSILLNENTLFQRLSMRVPTKVLEAFILPTLKTTESGPTSEICPIANSIIRLVAILSNEKTQLSAENKNRLIEIIYNYFISESRLYIVNETSSPLHMQFKYNILSKELAEFILSSLVKIDDKRCSAVLIEIGKDINLLKLLKGYMMITFQKELKQVSQQVSEILPDIRKLQDQKEFAEKIESISKLGNLKSLLRAAYLLTESALQQFKGILGRKQFNDQNTQMNGKLFEWANLLEDLIQDVTNSVDGKEFIIAGFELIYLEYLIKNQKISTTSLQLFEILVKLKAIQILVEEIAVPLKGNIESEGISGLPWNSLQKMISGDVTEAPQHLPVVMTFSQMRDCEVISIKDIYSFSLIKLKKQFIKEMLDSIAPNDISKALFCLKFSFLQNISEKEQSSGIRKPFSTEKIIEINRETHLQDSIAAYTFSFDDKSSYMPKINYEGEIGYDAGGLFRAWLEQNTKILFDPGFGLFHRAENPRVIHPNPVSRIIPDRLLYFEYAGYHVALAIRTNSPIDVHFTKSFYKMLLDRPLTIDDLEEIDSHLCASLRWVLDNDAEDLLQTFSYQSDFLGKRYVLELVPEGSNIAVSNRNKKLYVKLLAISKIQKEVAAEIDAFLFGFNQLLSLSTLQNFSPSQLEAVIAGASKIDIQDMKTYAKTSNSYSQEFLTWFWELLEEFDQNERSAFVYYISGSSNVSHGGFKDQPIKLSYLNDPEKLPVAHTCFRILDLPQYPSKEILREKLVTAIFEGAGAFQIE